MLSTHSVKAANELARRFADKNIKIMPKRGTLLDELQAAVYTTLDTRDIDSSDSIVSRVATDCQVYNSNSVAQETRHDSIMDAYIDDLASIASAHVLFNKSVVNKCVGAFRDELISIFNGFKPPSPEEVFNITYYKAHEIFSCDCLLDEIETGGGYGTTNLAPSDYINVGKINPTEYPLATYLMTGDSEFDGMIASWISSVGVSRLESYIYGNLTSYAIPMETMLDYQLANYLFYRNLSTRLDINIGLTTVQLRSKSVAIKNSFTNTLKQSIIDHGRIVKMGALISPSSDVSFRIPEPSLKLSITVLSENFDKFVEEGGSLECLFGYIAEENSTNKTYSQILSLQEKYLESWKVIRSMFLIKANNSRLDGFKSAINIAYDKVNMTLADGEDEARASDFNYQAEVDKMLDKYINSLTVSSIDCVDEVAIAVIAGIRFHYTNAYVFLTEMYNILKMSDKITVEEAALFAAIPYITEYMMGQSYIVK